MNTFHRYRRLTNKDYTNAGMLCELIFLGFALGSRIMDARLGIVGGLFALLGMVLIGRGYKGEWTF